MGKKGRCVKRNKQVKNAAEPEELVNAPHTFVLHRGNCHPILVTLTKDFRKIMEPFTASMLREKKSNKIKDFVNLSSFFHVSHMCIFNEAETQISFKILRLPKGPTLTFKVHQFALTRDVLSSQKKQFIESKTFQHPPLVILNSFSGEGRHIKLMATTFQNMFPSINLKNVKLSDMRRCVLISYNPTTKLIDLRHYAISVVPVGLAKGIKKVVLGKVPNLANCDDIADFISQAGALSDSEFEDEDAHVILPQKLKKPGNIVDSKSSIVLHELGPRITFQLMKVEEELLTGEVLYHDLVVKTPEEVEQLRKEKEKKKKLKELRKKEQKERENMKHNKNEDRKDKPKKLENSEYMENEPDNEPEDDAEYYREEVGQEPDEELFSKNITNHRLYVPKYSKLGGKRKHDDSKKQNDNGNKKRKTDFDDRKHDKKSFKNKSQLNKKNSGRNNKKKGNKK